jgi:hypothetical protein
MAPNTLRRASLTEQAADAAVDQACRMLRLPPSAASSQIWPIKRPASRCHTVGSSPNC